MAEPLTARGPLEGYTERFAASALTIGALVPVRQLSLRIDPGGRLRRRGHWAR